MDYQHLIYEVQDGVAVTTFNRPDKLNAFNAQTFEETGDVVARVGRDPNVRVLIFTGAGRAFSAGADMDMFAGGQEAGALGGIGFFLSGHNVSFRLHDDIENLTKPVIAAINGVAVGDGIELA
ncbi:MAG: enoyl-CoA hydratase/isomerase family protein, partial [Candidatus Binatia bacterium]